MDYTQEIPSQYQIPDKIWEKIVPLIPLKTNKIKPGRPCKDNRQIMSGIFYRLRTGCQWEAIPRSLGASSTVHNRFQYLEKQGFFLSLWKTALLEYDEKVGIDWLWQSMDGCHVMAPLGGKEVGPSYKCHFKGGTNRSLLVEGRGVPIGIVISKANKNDFKLAEKTLKSIPVEREEVTEEKPQHMSLDKGYDYLEIDKLLVEWNYKGEIIRKKKKEKEEEREKQKGKRWQVERTHAWMNSFRALKLRWERKTENYLGAVHLACAWISFKAAKLI